MSEELELMLAERAIQRVLTSYSRGVDRFDRFERTAHFLGNMQIDVDLGRGVAPTRQVPAAALPIPTSEASARPMTSFTTFLTSRRRAQLR